MAELQRQRLIAAHTMLSQDTQVTQVGFAKQTKCILQVNTDDEKFYILNCNHTSTHVCLSIWSRSCSLLYFGNLVLRQDFTNLLQPYSQSQSYSPFPEPDLKCMVIGPFVQLPLLYGITYHFTSIFPPLCRVKKAPQNIPLLLDLPSLKG